MLYGATFHEHDHREGRRGALSVVARVVAADWGEYKADHPGFHQQQRLVTPAPTGDEMLEPAAVGWVLMRHRHSAEWIVMHRRRRVTH